MEKILDCIKILNNPDFVNYRTCQVVYLTIYDSQGYKDGRKMYISLTCINSHTTHTHKNKTDYRYPSLKRVNVSKVTTWMWWQIPV